MRISIVDADALAREGIKTVAGMSDMEVVAESENACEIEELYLASVPDVIVMDFDCSKPHVALRALEALLKRHRTARVLVYSAHPEDPLAVPLLKWGVAGYLCKSAEPEELTRAIHAVHVEGEYISLSVARFLVREIQRSARTQRMESLTRREREYVSLLSAGKASSEIAHAMTISASSVRAYRRRILKKTGARSTEALVRYAQECQLID